MKISLSLMACVGAAFLLSLSGCAPFSGLPAPVSHKQATGQTPTYQPYYRSPAVQRNAPPPAPAVPISSATGKIKVAILLPLSGKNAALGRAMLNAAQQAVFDSAGTNFELQPHDTAGSGGAEDAARSAVAGGAQLVIGPLFATDVPVVAEIAHREGLQMLPLSTDASLAEPGVYVMGLAPGAQVDRIVAYAAARGAHHFAALVPDTPYGALVEREFRNAVARQRGGQLVDLESFGTAQEAGERIKSLAAQRDRIDALFLPESGDELKMVADHLVAAGLDSTRVHILGTGLWDVPGIGRLSPLLNGAWYAAPDPATRRTFVANYKAAYGRQPPRLATLAYDATALAAVIAKRGALYDGAALTDPNGFAGLDGIFRLMPSGAVEREMAVSEVTPDGARVIDSAPTSFIGMPR